MQFGRQPASLAADLLTVRFFGTRRMLVGTNNGGVEEQMLHMGITAYCRGHTLPDTRLAPA